MSKETPDYHRELEKKREKQLQKVTEENGLNTPCLEEPAFLHLLDIYLLKRNGLKSVKKKFCSKVCILKATFAFASLRPPSLQCRLPRLSGKSISVRFGTIPDLCLITGDFVTDQPEIEQLKEYANLLKSLGTRVPTFACMGNHDGGKWAHDHGGFSSNQKIKNLLRSARIEVLENERKQIHINGQRMDLVGLGDLWSENCRPQFCLEKLSVRPKVNGRAVFCSIIIPMPRMHYSNIDGT